MCAISDNMKAFYDAQWTYPLFTLSRAFIKSASQMKYRYTNCS